jgi:MinD-like ATPase involved in chromosome partitioning or flagellar assembly
MSQIVTFYSYKGGVGRSMAVANVAVLLGRRGLRVLVVDWDLEAPGLERYFTYFKVNPEGRGLMNMFTDRAEDRDVDYGHYLWTVAGDDFEISFLPSGKDIDADYPVKLEEFAWDDFFRRGGGDFVESLRDRWRADYDMVLIDSRTGLSDTGGICTIQLPDVVVAMFTANHQSLYGVRDVMRLVQGARQTLAYDRMQLAIVPLASRFGARAEFRESQEWLDRFAEVLSEFYRDWLPAKANQRQVVERLKIPQVDYFGFGEKLAVVEQGTTDPEGMGFVYDKVATLLATDLRDAEHVLDLDLDRVELVPQDRAGDYSYDLFVSYARSPAVEDALKAILDLLAAWVGQIRGRDLRIFFDYTEVGPASRYSDQIGHALSRSKLLLAIITPGYFESLFTQKEWQEFEERENAAGLEYGGLIVPVVLREPGPNAPEWFRRRQYFDLSEVAFPVADPKSLAVNRRVQDLAEVISKRLEEVPSVELSVSHTELESVLTRLRGLRTAEGKAYEDEKWHLGAELDRLGEAIARTGRDPEWRAAYDRIRGEILLKGDRSQLEDCIDQLERLR